ncbi:hypothetical protein BJ508DRAFT_329491 [Ascobolus immersus RN42]|uniref:Uncharacterized protein n=1 Tax=Ascobolus immersus RN42 TaxID=1160509 RepID=A0A3N4HWI4_ASCIM|nr:hypothetical protein BJ508DRAFT_329491 [Ascobolus immersus RN42]
MSPFLHLIPRSEDSTDEPKGENKKINKAVVATAGVISVLVLLFLIFSGIYSLAKMRKRSRDRRDEERQESMGKYDQKNGVGKGGVVVIERELGSDEVDIVDRVGKY